MFELCPASVRTFLLQIGQRDLEYPSLQCIVGILETSGSVDERLANTRDALAFDADMPLDMLEARAVVLSNSECGWRLD